MGDVIQINIISAEDPERGPGNFPYAGSSDSYHSVIVAGALNQVWKHEYCHVKGVRHRGVISPVYPLNPGDPNDPYALMAVTVGANNNEVNRSERNKVQ